VATLHHRTCYIAHRSAGRIARARVDHYLIHRETTSETSSVAPGRYHVLAQLIDS